MVVGYDRRGGCGRWVVRGGVVGGGCCVVCGEWRVEDVDSGGGIWCVGGGDVEGVYDACGGGL